MELIGGCGAELGEGVCEPVPGMGSELSAGGGEAGEDGEGLSAAVGSEEEPVLASNGVGLHGPFGRVVVNGKIAVSRVDGERGPLVTGIGDGLAERALRQRGSGQ